MSTVGLPASTAAWSPQSYAANAAATTTPPAQPAGTPLPAPDGTRFTPSAAAPAIPAASPSDPRFLHVAQWPGAVESTGLTYESLAQLQARSGQMQVWEQAPGATRTVDQIMGRNASASNQQSRFVGLGSALLEQAASTGASYRQTIVNVGAASSPDKVQGKATDALWAIQSRPSASVALGITTRSGATVRLSMADQKDMGASGSGITVQIKVDGTLSTQEKDALQSLAKGFDKAIQGLTGAPPTLDLEGLVQFDSQVLAGVDLQVDQYGLDEKGARILTLGTHIKADASTREVELKTPKGTVAMATDLRQPSIWGTAAQKAKAVQQYLGRIDKAAERGHADQELVDLFKSTFTAMNAGYGSAGNAAETGLSAIRPADLARDADAFSEEDQSLLTGLADFKASISATRRASNPRRLKEVDSFDYTLNQSTQISGTSRSNRAITQTQTAKLSAAYHLSLFLSNAPPKLTSLSASQNYYYKRVEDSSSTKMELAYDKDAAMRAVLTQTSSQSLHVLRVELNRITENTEAPAQQQSRQTDLLPLLKDLKRRQDAAELSPREKQEKLQEWNGMVLQELGAP
jgi:hypothetical protein